jgi:hypothetical protein
MDGLSEVLLKLLKIVSSRTHGFPVAIHCHLVDHFWHGWRLSYLGTDQNMAN